MVLDGWAFEPTAYVISISALFIGFLKRSGQRGSTDFCGQCAVCDDIKTSIDLLKSHGGD